MNHNHEDAKQLTERLDKLKSLKSSNPREENLFQIGGRGHYENPTTQILEFFLNKNRGHGFNTLILDALLETAQVVPGTIKTQMPYWTTHEVVVDIPSQQDRMDLVLESDSWVIVIENKIRHWAANDFKAYESFANNKKKEVVLIILSIREEKQPRWHSLKWKDLIKAIRYKIELHSSEVGKEKWPLFLHEFLTNVEDECSGVCKMDNELFESCLSNSKELFHAQEVFQNFLSEIQSRWENSFNQMDSVKVKASKSEGMWQGKYGGGWRCIPIRFILDQPDMEIVLKVYSTGTFGINLYPRLGIGLTQEMLTEIFSDPYQVTKENGYLACICADRQSNLSIKAALTEAQSAINKIQTTEQVR